MTEMEIGGLSLDDYIKEKKISGRQSGGAGRRQGRDGGVQKPKRDPKKWGNDKFFENQGRRSGVAGAGRISSGGKAIARLSNVPFNITQQDLTDLFAEYRLTKIALHFDYRGRSLGTAELHGSSQVIQNLAREFKDVEIDGRPLAIQVVGEGGSSLRSGGGRSPRRMGGGAGRRNSGPSRRREGGNKGDGRKKLTADELDKELEAYMQQTKGE